MADKYAPDSLKYQWRVAGLVTRSSWATGLDKSVAYEIIDNYRKEHGNSRASLSYLQTATGADRKAIIASTRRLVEHGPFRVLRQGAGVRPTEYQILFDLVAETPSSGVGTTTGEVDHSSGLDTTPCSGVATTTSAASSGLDTTESVLLVDGLQPGLRDRMNNDCAPPSAPPGSAPGGPTGADGHKSERTPFDELWSAYGHRQKRADARAAYEKLAPSPELHREMVDAASAWRKHWERQDNPDAPRKTLRKWIEVEGYREDPPKGYAPRKNPAQTKAVAVKTPSASAAVNDHTSRVEATTTYKAYRGPNSWPAGRNLLRIIDSQIVVHSHDNRPDGQQLVLSFEIIGGDRSGDRVEHEFWIESCISKMQDDGNRYLRDVIAAVGLRSIDDTDVLHGAVLAAHMQGGVVVYGNPTETETATHAADWSSPELREAA